MQPWGAVLCKMISDTRASLAPCHAPSFPHKNTVTHTSVLVLNVAYHMMFKRLLNSCVLKRITLVHHMILYWCCCFFLLLIRTNFLLFCISLEEFYLVHIK